LASATPLVRRSALRFSSTLRVA
jgi:hypothetical protein